MVEGEVGHQPGYLNYVCGFMFSPDREQVVLIRKNRPPWQAGLLNGVGGKIEHDEDALDAMVREFREETGVTHEKWNFFCELALSRGGTIYIWCCTSEQFASVRSPTDEQVQIVQLNYLRFQKTMPNVQWLVPMALSFERGEKSSSFLVEER